MYSLDSIEKTIDDLVTLFEVQLRQLIQHDFISQQQSKYFTNRKENLTPNEMLIISDFSENYTFIAQDAIQSFHWSNKQCTIHPFALYWKNEHEDKVQMLSIIVIAESLKHDINAVYLFQQKVITYIQQNFQAVKKLTFFSDGAGGQYKNRKNFFNICQYKAKYGLDVEWHCFGTAHGKSACDGIGGTFKRNARRVSLQRTDEPITNAIELFEWAKSKHSKTHFIFCSNDDYNDALIELTGLYERVKTIDGTQSLHSFVPFGCNEIVVRKYSDCEESKTIKLIRQRKQ